MPENTTTDQKLDAILEHLENMDKRDRLRMWGGFLRGLISIIPVIILIWSVWYTIEHGAELMELITKQAAKQAAAVTSESAGSFQQQLQQYMNR